MRINRHRISRSLTTLALLLVVPACAHAQEAPPATAPEGARVVTFSPRSGPPGTEVRVSVTELPSITPVYLTLGGTSSGFEVLGDMLMTSLQGELSETVRIPSWAARDQLHLFVVMDVYFGRLTASEPFHVTGADGTILREGRVEEMSGECVTFLGEDGEPYTLTGALEGVRSGDEMVVEGTLEESDACGDAVTIRVRRITSSPAPAPPP